MKNNYLVEKANALNLMKPQDMTLNEFRFFCLYLSRVNARNQDTRNVKLTIEEFESFFGTVVNVTELVRKASKILSRQVLIKGEEDYELANIYSKFCWSDEKEFKELTICCNADIMPYIFNLKNCYTSYAIGNISGLHTIQQMRMYELLKQFEKVKSTTIKIDELCEMIGAKQGREYKVFKRQVLEPTLQEVNEKTDIYAKYKPIKANRKTVALEFTIFQNFQKEEVKEIVKAIEGESPPVDKSKALISHTKIDKEKLQEKVENAYSVNSGRATELIAYAHNILVKNQGKGNLIANEEKYILGIIERAIHQPQKTAPFREQSYDIEEFEQFDITNMSYIRKCQNYIANNECKLGGKCTATECNCPNFK